MITYLPSLLEYSGEKLKNQLDLVQNNLHKFQVLQNNYSQNFKEETGLAFHLDLVLPQFAKDRKVMSSVGLKVVLENLESRFWSQKLDLSIHLMGTIEDLIEVKAFLDIYNFNPNWVYTFYLPKNYLATFSYLKSLFAGVNLGIWYDFGEWTKEVIEADFEKTSYFLLMTVLAGKSGQKLSSEAKSQALEIVKRFPKQFFLVDGGWSVDGGDFTPNLQIVSYSSFWKKFSESL